jgi:transcriptional regulator with XRE-family HTH domain
MRSKESIKRDKVLKKLGRNIRAARKKQGLSQEALALAADLDRSYIGGVERGERNIAVVNLKRIADALQLPVSELLTSV